jgi:hypothetical protein
LDPSFPGKISLGRPGMRRVTLHSPRSTAGLPHLCDRDGSLIPFARTRREREATGDPRPSLEERYGGRDDRRPLDAVLLPDEQLPVGVEHKHADAARP